MNKLTLPVLGKLALGIAFAGSAGLYGTRWIIQNKFRDSESYKEALQCLRANTNAVNLLGEPIIESLIDIGDNSCCGRKDNITWITVPLEGKNHKGYLQYWTTVTDRKKNQLQVSKIILSIKGSEVKILLKDDPVEVNQVPQELEYINTNA